jgi:hypothetical protein
MGGYVHWHMKRLVLVILSEENHEKLRASDGSHFIGI